MFSLLPEQAWPVSYARLEWWIAGLSPTGWHMTVTQEDGAVLTRAQNRLLRRLYNGRSVPIIADGKSFLTYRDASLYLQSLPPQARDAAYAEMKSQAKSPRRGTEA